MPQFNFGTGLLVLIPSGANPTPVQVGTLQDVSLDFEREVKMLHGNLAFPVDVAVGKGKVSGKFTAGELAGGLISAMFPGSTSATGQKIVIPNEAGTIPGTPFQVTVANGATFDKDLGVLNTTTGLYMLRVASAPATGQYSVNTSTGVYTFAAADTTQTVLISYTYTSASTGKTIALANQLMGASTLFSVIIGGSYRGLASGVIIYAIQPTKYSFAFKNDDYTTPAGEFSAFADPTTTKVVDAWPTR